MCPVESCLPPYSETITAPTSFSSPSSLTSPVGECFEFQGISPYQQFDLKLIMEGVTLAFIFSPGSPRPMDVDSEISVSLLYSFVLYTVRWSNFMNILWFSYVSYP